MFNAQSVAILGCLLVSASALAPALAAEDLGLAPGVSYNSDSGTVFPVVGQNLSDAKVEAGRANLIFFGAAGDLNTNRQAKRLVDLYKKERDRGTKFIVVDVDHPLNEDARGLIKKYYQGYVPAQLLLDRAGQVQWREVGEVSRRKLHSHIDNTM